MKTAVFLIGACAAAASTAPPLISLNLDEESENSGALPSRHERVRRGRMPGPHACVRHVTDYVITSNKLGKQGGF
jgi:hypothetical protein